MKLIVGIDEVGRGPVAGPVVVCACAVAHGVDILPFFPKNKLRDSKKLSEKARLSIIEATLPLATSLQIISGIGEVSAERIDEIGISVAIKEAIQIALTKIHAQGVSKDSFIFLDGSLSVDPSYQQETIIKGDEKIPEIALASIVAKVYRDQLMQNVGEAFPQYGFGSHVGYGTKAHYEAIQAHGLTPFHRRTFLKNVPASLL